MPSPRQYWFPAKRYGWGWGLPTAWQGWLVMAALFGAVLAGAIVLLPRYGQAAFVAYDAGLVVVFGLVCWLKGEPPRWRHGKDAD